MSLLHDTSPLRVGVLDDHRSFGEALSLALGVFDDISPVGVVHTVDGLLALVGEHDPDVVLLDYQLSDGTGIECASALLEAGAMVRLILLTAHASVDVTHRAMQTGFERVLSKEAPLQEIVEAVRTAPHCHAPAVVKERPIRFSRRQREVLDLMGQGLDPASIAEELYISVHTARSHVKDVLRALGASTQLAAVTKAIREGYLLPPSKHDSYR